MKLMTLRWVLFTVWFIPALPISAEIEGHCVAFCDEPVASESSSSAGGTSFNDRNSNSSAPESPNEIQAKRLNKEGIKMKQDGDFIGAIFRYREALDSAKDFPGADQLAKQITKNIAKAENAVGNQAYERGDYINAVTYFEFATQKDPTEETYRKNLEDAKVSLGYHPVYNPGPENSKMPVVHPEEIQKPMPGVPNTLKIKDVPLPAAIQAMNQKEPFHKDIYDGIEDDADIILDALEKGKGDIHASIEYLENRVLMEGGAGEGTEALSYLEGFRDGMISVDEDLKMITDVFKDKKLAEELGGYRPVEKEVLEEEEIKALEKMLAEREKEFGVESWKTSRAKIVLEALDQGKGNIRKSMKYLEGQMKDPLSDNFQPANQAYHYLIGLSVYPDFVKSSEPQ